MYSHKDDLSMLLLDLNMPLMNGYEVLEHIRQDEQLVVRNSAYRFCQRLLNLGGNHYSLCHDIAIFLAKIRIIRLFSVFLHKNFTKNFKNELYSHSDRGSRDTGTTCVQ